MNFLDRNCQFSSLYCNSRFHRDDACRAARKTYYGRAVREGLAFACPHCAEWYVTPQEVFEANHWSHLGEYTSENPKRTIFGNFLLFIF